MTIKNTVLLLLCLLLAGAGLLACAESAAPLPPIETADDIRERFLSAEPGDVIEMPAGTFAIDRPLILYANNVTVRGAGIDATILDFKDQLMGAEGVLMSGSDLIVEDFAIIDTRGDALKINEGRNIVVRRVRTEWTNGPHVDNGAYGIYPVQTTNLLVEDCVAIGASDAGIYVGQSDNIIVRGNRVEFNVAGIEIENSVRADVYENVATNNTGGILVFNMPNIPKEGHSTRVYNNQVYSNNIANFAAPGTAVSAVPAGSGVLINSNDRVEVFDNDIKDNATANVLLASYYSTGYEGKYELAAEYDAFPETIYIYGNRFEGGGDAPGTEEFEALRAGVYGDGGSFPDVIWDGFTNPEKMAADGSMQPAFAICLDNGDSQVLNIDGPNGFKAPTTASDPYRCSHAKLEPVDLATLGTT